jgi:hypothetical protein
VESVSREVVAYLEMHPDRIVIAHRRLRVPQMAVLEQAKREPAKPAGFRTELLFDMIVVAFPEA